jgi:hypothetical protein
MISVFISIPWMLGRKAADGAGICNADVTKRLPGWGEIQHLSQLTAPKNASTARQIPAAAFFCAFVRINFGPTGRWNQNPIPGILSPGDGEARRCSQGLVFKAGGQR